MTLVFDTSILIDLERGRKETIAKIKELARVYPIPARITFINYFEFLLGIKEKNPKNKAYALSFLNKFSILHTTQNTASILTDLKYAYDKKGIRLPLADLLIASLVIEHNMTLVTKDPDFDNIQELKKISIR